MSDRIDAKGYDMADDAKREQHDGMETEYSEEEQESWDEQSEHERVAEVTGVGPYDEDEDDDAAGQGRATH